MTLGYTAKIAMQRLGPPSSASMSAILTTFRTLGYRNQWLNPFYVGMWVTWFGIADAAYHVTIESRRHGLLHAIFNGTRKLIHIIIIFSKTVTDQQTTQLD